MNRRNVQEQAKRLVREGNARRIVVEREGRTVAQLPLTFGVIGAVVAPALAVALGLITLSTRSTVRLKLVEPALDQPEPSRLSERLASGQ